MGAVRGGGRLWRRAEQDARGEEAGEEVDEEVRDDCGGQAVFGDAYDGEDDADEEGGD